MTRTMRHAMRQPFISLAILLPLLTALPALATAAPADPKSAEAGKVLDPADALFDKGKAAFNTGKVEEAYALYQKAWELKQTYDIAGNLAQVELKLGKKREAFEHITFALAHFPPSATTDPRPALEKVLAGLRQQLGALRITLNVPGAKVSIDGRVLADTQSLAEVFVEPGPHTIVAELAGYASATATETATAGAPDEVKLTLVKEAPPRKIEPPKLPVQNPKLPDEAMSRTRRSVVITGLVVGVVALGTGITMTLVSNKKSSDASTQLDDVVKAGGSNACNKATFQSPCDTLDSTYIARGSTKNVAIIGYVTAGVGFGGAALAYALWPRTKAEKLNAIRVLPAIGPRDQGLVVVGSF